MEKLRFDYSSSFDSYTIFWFNLVCLIFFFFQVNHKIKNRSTQSTLFQKQFFSLAHPNFILRDGIFLWNTFFFFFLFFFCRIFKDSSFTLAQCRKYLYTWRPDSCECEGIFSLSQFSFLGTFVSSIFIHSCHGFESYLKWTIFQPRSFCASFFCYFWKYLRIYFSIVHDG